MTAIVGVIHDGEVFIGGDSAGVGGYSMTIRADTKVFRNGGFVFGFTTSFRMGQLLRYAFQPPVWSKEKDLSAFMATEFVDAIRQCLKDGGWAKKDSEREEGGTFLVGAYGRLFSIQSDYQVGESVDGFDAVGSGSDVALGALYATAGKMNDPYRRMELALQAAERFTSSVCGPFWFEKGENR